MPAVPTGSRAAELDWADIAFATPPRVDWHCAGLAL
jgi:hypothetical protein